MRKNFNTINEEINRMKSLFGENRLYGNLVDNNIISEQRKFFSNLTDAFKVTLKSFDQLDTFTKFINSEINTIDDIIKHIDEFEDMWKVVSKNLNTTKLKSNLQKLKTLKDNGNLKNIPEDKMKAALKGFPKEGGMQEMVFDFWLDSKGMSSNLPQKVENRIAKINEDGSLSSEFNSGTGANNFVLSSYLQSDGKIIIVGTFTQYNGITARYIARLNLDGSLDLNFNSGGFGSLSNITDVVLQPDGKILIIGPIISYNGTNARGIARLNADGSLDSTFNAGAGADGVNSIALQPDGKIILVGSFTTFNNEFKKRIVRLNSDGSFDPIFNPGINDGASDVIHDVSLQTDGKIIISGYFSTYN